MTLLGEHPGIRFQAPGPATAPAPAEWRGDARDEVRLLVARRDGIVHTRFREIPAHLERGDLRTAMHQRAYPGEDISDRPLPETVIPHLLSLVTSDRPTGRYQVAELVAEVIR